MSWSACVHASLATKKKGFGKDAGKGKKKEEWKRERGDVRHRHGGLHIANGCATLRSNEAALLGANLLALELRRCGGSCLGGRGGAWETAPPSRSRST
eukprot:scaffold116_cov334-Pavlova_lutheri.AAC.79